MSIIYIMILYKVIWPRPYLTSVLSFIDRSITTEWWLLIAGRPKITFFIVLNFVAKVTFCKSCYRVRAFRALLVKQKGTEMKFGFEFKSKFNSNAGWKFFTLKQSQIWTREPQKWETFFPKSWAYYEKEMLMLVAEYPKECLHLDVLSPYRHNPRKHFINLYQSRQISLQMLNCSCRVKNIVIIEVLNRIWYDPLWLPIN